jgi:hypothetical protein
MAEARNEPAPMERGGGYNRASEVQAAGLSPALPLLRAAAGRVPLPEGTLGLADYGCSEGRNSMAPMRAAIEALRGRAGPERPISVVHTDLPDNDFASLFHELEGPDSYLRGAQGVWPSAVGRSFYQPILPPGSVTLGWSSWSVQWLSRAPCPIPDQLQVAFSRDAAARAAYAAQAAADWRAFLAARATELVPGGRLVVLTMALDDAGDFGYRPILDAMWEALGDLVAAGTVRRDEGAAMAIPTVGRGRADLLAPFGEDLGLKVETLEIFEGEDRIWAAFQADGDAAAYAARWTAFSRASVFPTLAARVAPDRRAAFVAGMSEGMERRLAAAPTAMTLPLARMCFAREG